MFSVIIHYGWLILQAAISFGVALPFILYLIYCIANLLKKQLPVSEDLAEEKDYAIIVSVTDETHDLQANIDSLLHLNYTNYFIYVVANSSYSGKLHFDSDKVVWLRPARGCNNDQRIHRYAIEHFRRPHTHLAILDGNSIADTEYLNELNVFFNQGCQAVQSLCLPKENKNIYDIICTTVTVYNRFFKGCVSFALGSSATLTGCGTAFTVCLYKHCLKQNNVTCSSFVKAIQYLIVSQGHQIAFAPKAIVHNAKTMRLRQLKQQHALGINTWHGQLTNYLSLTGKGISFISLKQFLFGILLLQPPLFTSFVLSVFCLLLNVWINTPAAMFWMALLLLFASCFGIAFIHLKLNQNSRKLSVAKEPSVLLPLSSLYQNRHNELYKAAQ